ncbi:hypothetical protein [Acidovorax sp. Root568]|uniref:hypothetical protein n=1 Tax=Acidovorax sp. Root568 TaxID=1736565 RepID=UPI0006F7C5E5|nr:hypothetical protein [Acidovorax sp. Root568]KRA18840.1 hypothetical protein ASD75_03145 [Acidovorax sp. Root568]
MRPQAISTPKTVASQQRLWQQLDMLCDLGLGLAPVAPDVCAVLRTLVGADAAALFWLDEDGLPAGFHHEDSPASTQDLFLNEYLRLFNGPGETNVLELAKTDGPRVGRLLAPGARYFRSNSYNLLVRASGHQHTLDLRVEVEGRTRAIAALFLEPGPGFSDAQARMLERACISLSRAFKPTSLITRWETGRFGATGHILLDAADQRPLLMDAAATELLRQANLAGLGVRDDSRSSRPQNLPQDLLQRLGLPQEGTSRVPVPHGWLVAKAHELHSLAGGAGQVILTLQLEHSRCIDVVRRVLALPLSPLQREIALLAGIGHARSECMERTGVGAAALKKHLRAIFEVTGAADWESLGRILQQH